MFLRGKMQVRRPAWQRGIGALGQSSYGTYSIPRSANNRDWYRDAGNRRQYASQWDFVDRTNRPSGFSSGITSGLGYRDVASLFGPYTVQLRDDSTGSDAWYIGDAGNEPSTPAAGRDPRGWDGNSIRDWNAAWSTLGQGLWQGGFRLATSTGTIPVDPYLWQAGVAGTAIEARARASSAERLAGILTNCSSFGTLTPTQGKALIAQGVNLQCVRDAAAKAMQVATETPEVARTPPAPVPCPGGYVPASILRACGAGLYLDRDAASGCVRCVKSACPSGYYPASVLTTCGPGTALDTDAASGCVRCAAAQPTTPTTPVTASISTGGGVILGVLALAAAAAYVISRKKDGEKPTTEKPAPERKAQEGNDLVVTTTGSFGHERKVIKRVPGGAHAWLNRQDNNDWQIYVGDLKPGTYAFVGGRWTNVKKIDPSALPHV